MNFHFFLNFMKDISLHYKRNGMRTSITFPTSQELITFLEVESSKEYTYPEVGATTQTTHFAHYDNDHNYGVIGKGETTWEKAKSSIQNWQQFPLPWTKIYPNTTPLKEGEVVAVVFRLFGIWWRNSARIVYTFDEPNRYGFAYGTLPGHIEMGEEVFWIERNKEGEVSYHIKAFSKPRFWLAKLGYPIARLYQRKFVRESIASMKRYCE